MVNDYHNITKGNVDFLKSQTRENLMRAFAGESQARNRYTFAAEIAKKQGLYVIEAVFKLTASQELAHANVFMKHLSDFNGENIENAFFNEFYDSGVKGGDLFVRTQTDFANVR